MATVINKQRKIKLMIFQHYTGTYHVKVHVHIYVCVCLCLYLVVGMEAGVGWCLEWGLCPMATVTMWPHISGSVCLESFSSVTPNHVNEKQADWIYTQPTYADCGRTSTLPSVSLPVCVDDREKKQGKFFLNVCCSFKICDKQILQML